MMIQKISLPLESSATTVFFTNTVSAGFSSIAEDYIDTKLDFNKYLVKHPEATFLVRVSGDSMIEVGIFAEDILVVDRSLSAQSGDVVIAVVNREFLVKKFILLEDRIILRAANKQYRDLIIPRSSSTSEVEFQVWGVVSYCLHAFRK